MSKLRPEYQEILAECDDDYVGLSSMVGVLRQGLPSTAGEVNWDTLRTVTIPVLKELLRDFDVKVGDLTIARGFTPWDLGTEESLQRIDREWEALGRDPTIGEIAWFTRLTSLSGESS